MGSVPLWTRVVADERFRAALVEDPLRAVADAGDVAVSPEQMRRLEGMDREERAELVGEVVKEVHLRGAEARFGRIGPDGRLGRY
jgi:hypothetical protein